MKFHRRELSRNFPKLKKIIKYTAHESGSTRGFGLSRGLFLKFKFRLEGNSLHWIFINGAFYCGLLTFRVSTNGSVFRLVLARRMHHEIAFVLEIARIETPRGQHIEEHVAV